VINSLKPFANCAHDHQLVLDICKGIRPKINEPEAPKCYIKLMKECWNLNPINRPNSIEIEKLINSYSSIQKQFKEAEEYRKANISSINKNTLSAHSQAIYSSRLLNHFTKDLPKYIDHELSSNTIIYNKDEDNYIDITTISESLGNDSFIFFSLLFYY